VLAGLYPRVDESYRIVDAARIPKTFVAFDNRAIDNWHSILTEAELRGRVQNVVAAALKDYPDNVALQRAMQGELVHAKRPVLGRDVSWRTDLPVSKLETVLGSQSTLLPVHFLELDLKRARSVARVQLPDGTAGTGFLIEDDLFVTNNHVLPDADHARRATITFNYQLDLDGNRADAVDIPSSPDDGFATSAAYDWTLVRMQPGTNQTWGAIRLRRRTIAGVGYVNIIQHPQGGYKQLACYHNYLTASDDATVSYLTDTLPGSSGSPVFDSEWEMVALHQSGGWSSPDGDIGHDVTSQIGDLSRLADSHPNVGININRITDGVEQFFS
jgi:hypothetical protein